MPYDYVSLIVSFLPIYFLLSVTPGLNMIASMNIGAAHGIGRAGFFITGALFGMVIVTIFSITGVVALISRAPVVFEIIRYAGAFYLVYLGYMFLRAPAELEHDAAPQFARNDGGKLATRGFLTAALNPKAWLFFAAFLPVFLRNDLPLAPQTMIIVLIVTVIEACCMLFYAFGGTHLGKLIRSRSNLRVLNSLNAFVMFALAGVVLWQ